VGVAWLLNRTTVGFQFRAVGLNPDAARAAGMSPTRATVAVMTLAGGLAGLAGANQLASVTPSLIPGFASGLGFDGIAIALLARARPIGVIFAAFLFGALRSGGRTMQVVTQTPFDIIVVIQALVIVFVAAPALVRAIYRLKAPRAAEAGTFAKGWGG
jgi:simple sugar transport system permease protein